MKPACAGPGGRAINLDVDDDTGDALAGRFNAAGHGQHPLQMGATARRMPC